MRNGGAKNSGFPGSRKMAIIRVGSRTASDARMFALRGVDVCLPLALRKRYNNFLNKKALQAADASLMIAFQIAKSRP